MRPKWAPAIIGLLLWQAAAAPAADGEGLRPEEVLVIANRASEASLEVAHHYMQSRRIPEGNLFLLDYAEYETRQPLDDNPLWMPHPTFRKTVVAPLKRFLETEQLKDKILCFVTVYDTPFRVGGFDFIDAQRTALVQSLSATENTLRSTACAIQATTRRSSNSPTRPMPCLRWRTRASDSSSPAWSSPGRRPNSRRIPNSNSASTWPTTEARRS